MIDLLNQNMREILILLAIIAALVGWARHWFTVRNTTLISTWVWWGLAIVLLGLDTLLSSYANFPTGWEALHYLVRMLTVCPVISLLGAKRPQDGPWNFVVFALWATLAIPAAVNYVQRGGGFEVQLAWSLVIGVLVLLTFVNLFPAHPPESLVVLAGHILLLNPYLFPPAWQSDPAFAHFGSILLLSGAWLGGSTLRDPVALATARTPLDRLWVDFRNTFGSFWALRVQERLNEAAQRYQWPLELTWSGWLPRQEKTESQTNPESLSPEVERQILAVFRGLLRRFVNHAWMNERLADTSHTPEDAPHA
jgi:hypothetical protein